MAKRGATSDLNQDNWNATEDKEEAGKFTPLSGSELQNRVIRKAKRNISSNSPGSSPLGSSPFAKFTGFSTSTSSNSPFGTFKPTFGTDNKSSFFSVAKKDTEKINGSSVQEEKSKDSTVSDISKIPTVKSDSSSKVVKPSSKQIRSLEYYKQLQSLNESVLKWMQLHLSKNACWDFTPVFNDYRKHMDTLSLTYPVISKEASSTEDSGVFKKPEAAKEMIQKDSSHSNANVSQKEKDETDYGANFKSNTTNTSTFSFGIQCTPTATSSGSPSGPTSSSKEGIEDTKKTSEFSFGFFSKANQFSSDKPFTFASAPVGKSSETGESEDPEYVPPKNEFVAVTEEDSFYSKRCKLFYKKEGSYVERGVGTIYLKKIDGKTQLLVRADTSLGNILLNIMLNASLPVSKTGKNNVLLVCIPNPPVDVKNPDSKEAIPILIRVKTSEDADELLETLEKNKS